MNTTEMHIPSNRVLDIERYILSELEGLYPKGELRMFVVMLFEAYEGWGQTQLLLHRQESVNQSDLLKFHWAVEDLKRFRPIQHIIGHTQFCDCHIRVSEDVLIPRPETEEIVLDTLRLLSPPDASPTPSHPCRILDLCTGSGCIAIALAKALPQAQVWGIDISPKAIEMARLNAEENQVDVCFATADILQGIPSLASPTFDLIISNPPYIKEQERALMQPNVLDYEPSAALFVPDNDPLLFYRAIGQYADVHLASDGLLVVEVNETLGRQTCQLLSHMGFSPTLRQDFMGKDRSIVAQKQAALQ